MFAEFLHEQLLGLVVRLVEVLRHPLVTRRRADGPPPRRLISSPAKPIQIHKTLHPHDRMSIFVLPVLGQTCQIQGHRPAGQIRILPRFPQAAEAGIVGHQMQPGPPLIVVPADPPIPAFEMVGSRRPSQQREPLPLIFGHVTQLLPHHPRALQVMVLDDQFVPARFLFRAHQTNLDLFHHRRFGGVR